MVIALTVFSALLVGIAGWAGPAPRIGPVCGVLALGALFLELLAVPLSTFGYFSAAPACVVALALVPEGGSAIAVFTALAGVTLRTLTRGRPDRHERMQEALTDLVPLLLAAFVAGSLHRVGIWWASAAALAGAV
ncbi:MAG: hypothetical protein FJX76_06570 [Armatimonadetes bacterium]|nr:hypothetical protein [Armatimonadota bacterium]